MARAPAPSVLPGEFFVLTYDRGDGSYTLFVDDDSRSSYNLGSDVEMVMRYFRIVGTLDAGTTDLGYRAVDIAREFGAAQAIPGQGRVFKVSAPGPQPDVFDARNDDRVYNLPPL